MNWGGDRYSLDLWSRPKVYSDDVETAQTLSNYANIHFTSGESEKIDRQVGINAAGAILVTYVSTETNSIRTCVVYSEAKIVTLACSLKYGSSKIFVG
jgi:hypothetical protein